MPEKSKKEKTEKSSRNQSGKTGSRKRLRIRITRNRIIAGITVLLTGIRRHWFLMLRATWSGSARHS